MTHGGGLIDKMIFSNFYNRIIEKYRIPNPSQKDIFLVTGAARSGTSLIMQLLKESGIFTGHPEDFIGADINNPKGYLEQKEVIIIQKAILKQSVFRGKVILSEDFSLTTEGLMKKVQRFFTRIKMVKFLSRMHNQAKDSWALKIDIPFFSQWQNYIPNFKIIFIYRNPVITAHSAMKYRNFSRTFNDYIIGWGKRYREAIYYFGRYPSIIINYDDLLNPGKRDKILEKLIEFTGRGKLENLKRMMSPELNRSSEEIKKIIDIYPLPQSIEEVLVALEKIKVD